MMKERVTTAVREDRAVRTGIMVVVLVVGLTLVVAAGVWAYGILQPARSDATQTVAGSYETPEQTVKAYYDAAAADNRAAGAAIVAPSLQPKLLDSFTSDFGNIQSIKEFVVKPAFTPKPAPAAKPPATPTGKAGATPTPSPTTSPVPTVEVPVTFVVEYRNQIQGDSGPMARWVVLARADGTSGPWQIVSIRSAP